MYYDSAISALAIVVITMLIAILVALISFFVVKGIRRYRRTGRKQFTPVRKSVAYRDEGMANNQHQPIPFPVLDQTRDVVDEDGDDGSEVSYEEDDDIDYETHLRNIS